MQEEVENKSVNLAIRTTTVSSRVLYQALRSFVQEQRSISASIRSRQQTREQILNWPGAGCGEDGYREFRDS